MLQRERSEELQERKKLAALGDRRVDACRNATSARDAALEDIAALKREIAAYSDSKYLDLVKQRDAALETMNQTQQALDHGSSVAVDAQKSLSEHQSLAEHHATLQRVVHNTRQEISERRERCAKLEVECEDLRRMLISLRDEKLVLDVNIAETAAMAHKLHEERSTLEGNVDGLQRSLSELDAKPRYFVEKRRRDVAMELRAQAEVSVERSRSHRAATQVDMYRTLVAEHLRHS